MTFHFMSSIEIIAKLSWLHLIQSERIVMLKINLDIAALTLIFMPKGWKAFLILEKKKKISISLWHIKMWVNEIVLLQLGRETIDAYQNEYYSMLQEILIIPLKMNSLQICKDKLVKNIVYCCITLHCFV